MARTIPRQWPKDAPYGDYRAICDYCGVMWRRSQLVRDGAGLLVGPDCRDGRDVVTKTKQRSLALQQLKQRPSPFTGGNYDNSAPATFVYLNGEDDDWEL